MEISLQTPFPVKASLLLHRWTFSLRLHVTERESCSCSYKGTNLIMGPHNLI